MLDPDFKQRLRAARAVATTPPALIAHAEHLTDCLLALLFPSFEAICANEVVPDAVSRYENESVRALDEILGELGQDAVPQREAFFARLPEIHEQLLEDAQAIDDWDPAAKSVEEVILAYPGFRAIAVHRLAHALLKLGVPLVPRIMSEYVHRTTGIDIHPGAKIGRRFSIDHGTGIVIGETAEIGDGVKLFQGVTLGALSVKKSMADRKRHPTIEDDVTIYASAIILGGKTVVGKGSTIGGNVWLTRSVPAGSMITRDDTASARA